MFCLVHFEASGHTILIEMTRGEILGSRYSNSRKSVHVNSVQANRMIVGMFLKSVKEHEEQNKACDCCCVQGIRDELRKLVNRSVRITTGSNNYAGTVSSVTCEVVKLANSAGVVTVIISVCKIEAIEPLLT